jgi:hypothetical protein
MSSQLAVIKIAPSHMPLTPKERADFVLWLRQVADEVERGEHWDSALFGLTRDYDR